jgi:hypothetical protein
MVPNWSEMKGGYRVVYDPRPAIARLVAAPLDQAVWDELWNELHHQGDLGEASYAAVPLLVEVCETRARDWNLYGLIATIEVERYRASNPDLPEWLAESYLGALRRARLLALSDLADASDRDFVRSAMAVVALVSGDRELGALLVQLDSSEIHEVLEKFSRGVTCIAHRPAMSSLQPPNRA